jgi:putative oxidoreductase
MEKALKAPTGFPLNLVQAYAGFETGLWQREWPKAIVLLAARIWVAKFFFYGGLTKIASWPATVALFTNEYKVPVLPPEIAAYMSATAELGLPIFLVLGLFTRFAAAGFFVMTTVIQLFVYPDAAENPFILITTAALVVLGSGKLGADYWIGKKLS